MATSLINPMMSPDLAARMGPEVAAATPAYQYRHLVSHYLILHLGSHNRQRGAWALKAGAKNGLVLMWLLDATLGRGRPSVVISYKDLAKRVRLSQSFVERSAKDLSALGLVTIHKRSWAGAILINEYTPNLSVIEKAARSEML